MALPCDISAPCLRCEESCSGFKIHKWRSTCGNCDCSVIMHDISDDKYPSCLEKMGLKEHKQYSDYQVALTLAKQLGYQWLPIGLSKNEVEGFLYTLPPHLVEHCKTGGEGTRAKAFRLQIPIQDRNVNDMRSIGTEVEKAEAQQFVRIRNNNGFGVGVVERQTIAEGQDCADCQTHINQGEFCVRAKAHAQTRMAWHHACFKCSFCREVLVDHLYCWHSDKPFCEKHYAQLIRPRCAECDELIFTEEYTKAMEQDHHIEHFACKQCDNSLTGHRYILKNDQPYCLPCYEEVFAHTCDNCHLKIGSDSKDLSFKDRHWHEKCFTCSSCKSSLVDHPFATRDEALYCSNCFDEKFSPRCDACFKVFKSGTRKFEYRGQQWHEECFTCSECKQPIGSKSFIPHEATVVCVPCYEQKFAQRCTKCKEVIRRGGVTYKNEPWHKECFSCKNCDKQLSGIKFITKEDQPYCQECYGELFSKKCCKCLKPITGIGGCKFIAFEDRHWHSECFNCSKCSINLVGKGFLTNNDQITCPECGR
jgi:hypothetical protein